MKKWSKYTGDEILYNSFTDNNTIGGESMFEDAMKQGLLISSGGDCQILKFHYTDGFGWYFQEGKITFILHECKVGDAVTGKTLKGYKHCLQKAFLQSIGYYYKIKNREFNKFSKRLTEIAAEFGYDDVSQFVIDNFGMFLITTPKFISQITMRDPGISEFIQSLEPKILQAEMEGYTPSTYHKCPELKEAMNDLDIDELQFEIMPDNVDLADTGEILNNILTLWN